MATTTQLLNAFTSETENEGSESERTETGQEIGRADFTLHAPMAIAAIK